ncbi:MAG: hypothetical protein ACYTDW_06660 [Planctomycetota bacterium]
MAEITLDMSACWEVAKGRKDCQICFRELPKLFPPSSTLCIEGTSIAEDVKSYLDAHRVKKITKVHLGTLWPRPSVYHVPCDEQTLSGLVKLAAKHAQPELADHLYVYKDQELLLEWNDAFSDPIYISKKVSEDKVSSFCTAIKCTYKDGSVPDWPGKKS